MRPRLLSRVRQISQLPLRGVRVGRAGSLEVGTMLLNPVQICLNPVQCERDWVDVRVRWVIRILAGRHYAGHTHYFQCFPAKRLQGNGGLEYLVRLSMEWNSPRR